MLGEICRSDDYAVAAISVGKQVNLGVSDRLSKDPESGLPCVHFFENVNMPVILQAHDGGTRISYHHLLKGEDILDVPQRALIPKYALEEVEGIIVQHPHDCIDACGVGEDPQLVITFKEGPVELPLAHESGVYDTQAGTVVQLEYGLARFIAVGFRREQVHEANFKDR